jgi:hypothetical protein
LAKYKDFTDKDENRMRFYEPFFAPFKNSGSPINLLELGVAQGGSLMIYRDYFPFSRIIGLDQNPAQCEDDTLKVCVGNQVDTTALRYISQKYAPDGWHIIIDDCSHLATEAWISYAYLFPSWLKSGGIYVIEDWGTGYWDHWPDGEEYKNKIHTAGMVGLVHNLVDEVGRPDREHTIPGRGVVEPGVQSSIAKMTIAHGSVIVEKP